MYIHQSVLDTHNYHVFSDDTPSQFCTLLVF